MAFFLDPWIFPGLNQTQVAPPVFIVGMPRSGTTYFHRLLAEQSGAFTAMPLWELLFAPALCEKFVFSWLYQVDRRLGAPCWRVIQWLTSTRTAALADVHTTGFCQAEEDYLGLLPFDGCFLRVLMFPFSGRSWSLAFPETLPSKRHEHLLAHYRGLLIRHQRFRGSELRIVSKNPSFSLWVDGLANTFPGATFVGMRREPIAAVGSQLSSIASGLEFFGHQAADRRVAWRFIGMLRAFWHELNARRSDMSVTVIDYQELKCEPYRLACSVIERSGVDMRRIDLAALRDLCEQGRAYRSHHHYQLSDFGLDEAQVQRVFTSPDCSELRPASFAAAGRNKPARDSVLQDWDWD